MPVEVISYLLSEGDRSKDSGRSLYYSVPPS